MDKAIENLPADRILKEKSQYFWWVSHPDWMDGRKQRIRRNYKDARHPSNLVGYTVEWCGDQIKPQGAAAGTQAALVYGTRVKRKKKKKSKL